MKTAAVPAFAQTLAVSLLLALAACDRAEPPPPPLKPGPRAAEAATPPSAPAPAPAVAYPPVEPIEPGQPGGLPDDRTPISEAPFTPQSAQGAADVVQTYFAHIGQGAYGQAWKLMSGKARGAGLSEAAFLAERARYSQYAAQVGGPGRIEGAAGSLYVTVPVQVYGRLKTGQPFHQLGEARLSRVNDVPGSTAEQRLWRIDGFDLKPVG